MYYCKKISIVKKTPLFTTKEKQNSFLFQTNALRSKIKKLPL